AGASHTVNPTSNTTYTVTGTDINGCENTDNVTITVNPLPTIDASSDATSCAGENVTISATGGSTYSWDNGLGAGASHTINPTNTATYTVTGTDANGCENTDDVEITVNPLPTVTTSADDDICVGENTTISASGADSYTWNNGLGAGISHTVNPTNTTTYEATGTDVNGCENTDQVTITVNQIDDPSFTFTDYCDAATSNGPSNIATPGGTFGFNPTPTGGTTIDATSGEISGGVVGTTYSVEYVTNGNCPDSSIETVTVQTNDDPTFDYNDICLGNNLPIEPYNIGTSGGTFSFVTTPADGATIDGSTGEISNASQGSSYDVEYLTPSGVCQASSTETIQVYNAPTVTASNDETVCDGEAVTITASGADSYTWDNGLGSGSSQNVTPSNTTTYIVTGEENTNGCTNTDEVVVTVNPLPAVDPGTDEAICDGDDVTLSASGADNYSWDNGLGAGASHTTNPSATTTYEVIGTDLNGCENSAVITITVNPLPTVDAGNDQFLCEGDDVTLTASGADNYTWDNGITQGIPFTPSVGSTTYTVTGTDANGCENTDQVEVSVEEYPSVNAGDDQTLCANHDPITLSGNPSGGTYSGNGITGLDFDPNEAGVGSHDITYTYETANGCESTDVITLTVDGCASIDENNILNELSIMPNPATDYLDIVFDNSITINNIELMSAEGRFVQIDIMTLSDNKTRVNVSNAEKGTYFIRLNTSNGNIVKKVIIH
ncbi:MAG: T9SS type A sorting domain-containing protein, partial [Brumimicrobium sp.]